MNYATKEDLAMWLGHMDAGGAADITQLPEDVERLIRNASRVIDHATMGGIDISDQNHLDVAMNATTAQCEFWIDGMGESVDINPNMKGYNAGKTSFDFANGIPKLAPRARRELWLGGLLNRKVIRV
jgi:hypothetical protein